MTDSLRKELALVSFEQKECMKEAGQRQGPPCLPLQLSCTCRGWRPCPAEPVGPRSILPGASRAARAERGGQSGDRPEDPCGERSDSIHELLGETLWSLPRVLGEGVPVEGDLLGAEAPCHR